MTVQPESGQSPRSLLPRWANNQDSSVRTIAADVLKNRVQCAEEDIDRFVKHFLAEKKLSDDSFEVVPKIEEKQLDGNPLDSVRVDSLKVGDGINAIKAGVQIDSALVEKGYEELRGLCEISVEHEMLKGVVQRYEPNVMMTKVERINVAELQRSMAVVMPAFEKACRYIASHSQPIETQGIRPTLQELKADLEAVLKAREPHKD